MANEIVDSLLLRASLIVKRESTGNVVPEAFKKSAFVTPKQFFHVSKAPITLLALYRRYNTVYQSGLTDAMDIMLRTLNENKDAPHETKKLLEKAINQIADELVTEKLSCAE